jgi:hypothetical protein
MVAGGEFDLYIAHALALPIVPASVRVPAVEMNGRV